jgi:hypothetical protein
MALAWPILYQLEDGDLRVFDVSNPAIPLDLGVQIRGGLSGRPVLDSGFLYLRRYDSAGGNFLLSIDATNPVALTLADSLQPPGDWSFGSIRTFGGSVGYSAAGDSIYVLDISDPFDLRPLPGLASPYGTSAIEIASGRLLAAGASLPLSGSTDTLVVFDVSNPASPQAIAGTALPLEPSEYILDSAVHGTDLLLLTGRRLLVLDTTTLPPTLRSSLDLVDSTSRMSVGGDLVALTGSDALTVVDIANSSSPTVEARYHPGPELDDVAIHAHYAFLSLDEPLPPQGDEDVGLLALTLWDAPTPARSVVTAVEAVSGPGTWERIRFSRSGFDSECAYGNGVIGHHILRRIETLAKGTHLAPGLSWPGRIGDAVRSDKGGGSLLQGDPLPPGDWEVVGSAPALQQDSYAVLLSLPTTPNTYVVVAHTAVPGLYFVSAPFPDVPSDAGVAPSLVAWLHPNIPNPFNPTTTIRYSVPEGGDHVLLQVFDAAGRLVTTLLDGFVEGGEHRVEWSARRTDGRPLGSGVYLCQLQTSASKATRRMVLVR